MEGGYKNKALIMNRNQLQDFFGNRVPVAIIQRHYMKTIGHAFNLLNHFEIIEKAASDNDINPNLLLAFIAVESSNRKGLIFIEKFAVKFLPSWVVKRDFSLGIAQLKPKTVINELNLNIDRMLLVKKLMQPSYNIDLCSKLLNHYSILLQESGNVFDKILGLVKLYTTGKPDVQNYPWIVLYAHIVHLILNDNLFEKISKRKR